MTTVSRLLNIALVGLDKGTYIYYLFVQWFYHARLLLFCLTIIVLCCFAFSPVAFSFDIRRLPPNKHPRSFSLSKRCHNNTQVLHPLIHKYQTNQSYKQATDPNRIAVLSPDMRRIRAKQQQIAQQRSIEAEEKRKQYQKEERERKRVKSPEEERWDRLGGVGKKLGSVGRWWRRWYYGNAQFI